VLIDTLVSRRSNFEVALDAFHALSNAIYGAQQRQIELLVQCNVMFAIFQFLKRAKKEIETMVLILETTEHLLSSLGSDLRNQLMDKCNGIAVLEDVRSADEYSCHAKAQRTISNILSLVV